MTASKVIPGGKILGTIQLNSLPWSVFFNVGLYAPEFPYPCMQNKEVTITNHVNTQSVDIICVSGNVSASITL